MNSIYKVVFIFFSLLMLLGCFSNDDEFFGRQVSLNIQDAFTFQNEKEYVVGDTIYFELTFSRYLPEEGYPELLDVYETTKEEQFGYSFNFEGFSEQENGFRIVNIDPEFIIAEIGDVTDSFFYSDYGIVATLNATQDTYESTVGIILREEGLFRFDFDNVFIQTPFEYENVQVSIWHSYSDRDDVDVEFTVLGE